MTLAIYLSANCSPLSESEGFHIFALLTVEPAAEAHPTCLVTEDENIC